MDNHDPSPKRARLVDVAREANVSVQAVSLVMSGKAAVRISDTTRTRIQEAADRVGYSPNRLAQAMKSGKTGMIALWLPLDRPTTTYFRMLEGLSEQARSSGYRLMIIGVDKDLAYRGAGSVPDYWPVDGVLAVDSGKAIQHFRDDRRNDATPVVVLALEEYSNADTVCWDVYGGVRKVVERAIVAGRRRIVHISPAWVLADYPREQRRRGYSEAMLDAWLEPQIIAARSESSEGAEQAMAEYLAENPVPQAVIGFLDNLAIGAARALLAVGARIPEDCWIIGVGDTPEGADFRVPISSLRVPVADLVDQAWNWLMSRIADITQERRKIILPMDFIERESTRT